MGEKGSKMNIESVEMAELLQEKLSFKNGITMKKMFGGHGIFHEEKMFGLVDSKGGAFVRGDKSKKSEYEVNGRVQHSRMPYFSVSSAIINSDEFESIINEAIDLSKT